MKSQLKEVVVGGQLVLKDIVYKNIKNLYKIDEYGNVWSKYKNGYLKPKIDKDGYLVLSL